MKSRVFLGLLVVAVAAFSVQAQPPGGGGGFGFRGVTGDSVADILVLNSDAAAKVVEKMNAAREEVMASRGDAPAGGDPREAFQQLREEMNKKYVEALKTVLSAEEVKTVEPFLNSGNLRRTEAPIRALRQIDLKDEQRAEFRTETVALITKLDEIRPGFGGGRGGGGGGQGLDDETRAKLEDARKAYSEKILAKLSDEQKSAWETKTAEVEKELEEQRAQRGAGGGRGN